MDVKVTIIYYQKSLTGADWGISVALIWGETRVHAEKPPLWPSPMSVPRLNLGSSVRVLTTEPAKQYCHDWIGFLL